MVPHVQELSEHQFQQQPPWQQAVHTVLLQQLAYSVYI